MTYICIAKRRHMNKPKAYNKAEMLNSPIAIADL